MSGEEITVDSYENQAGAIWMPACRLNPGRSSARENDSLSELGGRKWTASGFN
jgi:hypothetical protein